LHLDYDQIKKKATVTKIRQTIRKAIIPAAGLGTRFLPATKIIPKELLPIVDTPVIQYNVQEVADAGIKTVILVTGKGKTRIIDHFDVQEDLKSKLEKEGRYDLVSALETASNLVQFASARQDNPRGLGHAVLCTRDLIGQEAFVVLLGDDLLDSDPAEASCTAKMIQLYQKYGKSVVALMEVPEVDVYRYGICNGRELEPGVLELDYMVEKPRPKDAPSNLAIIGRYILTPRIFDILENTPPGRNGELQLTDAMAVLMKEEGFIGYKFKGQRFDAGDKLGFIKANLAYALKRKELGPKLRAYMREILEQN
jgi:UTP--glucose-1-phosphate uridylyltransferase